jgi:methylase of polypeptide subunit release factors
MTSMADLRERPAAPVAQGEPLLELLRYLDAQDYAFVTPTPATHARVVARPGRRLADGLTDIFGWSLPFERGALDPAAFALLEAAGQIERLGPLFKSRLRVSTIDAVLFLHSAFPTDGKDAVFLGPDSYRFANLIDDELAGWRASFGARLVDIGTGAGVGAIVAARRHPGVTITMTDINPAALQLARVNARAAGIDADFIEGSDLGAVSGRFDVMLANPPYIIDEDGPDYRNGRGLHGGQVALDMARDAVPRLASDGRLILYTGSAILAGIDPLRRALAELARVAGCRLRYREIDPDVFGEELDKPAYRDVDRIALVAAIITRDAAATRR